MVGEQRKILSAAIRFFTKNSPETPAFSLQTVHTTLFYEELTRVAIALLNLYLGQQEMMVTKNMHAIIYWLENLKIATFLNSFLQAQTIGLVVRSWWPDQCFKNFFGANFIAWLCFKFVQKIGLPRKLWKEDKVPAVWYPSEGHWRREFAPEKEMMVKHEKTTRVKLHGRWRLTKPFLKCSAGHWNHHQFFAN